MESRIPRFLPSPLRKLASDDSAEIPVGGLLIVGLIVIPLVIGLIVFRADVYTWFVMQWVEVHDQPSEIQYSTQ